MNLMAGSIVADFAGNHALSSKISWDAILPAALVLIVALLGACSGGEEG